MIHEPIDDFSDPREMRQWEPTRMTVDEAKELLDDRIENLANSR